MEYIFHSYRLTNNVCSFSNKTYLHTSNQDPFTIFRGVSIIFLKISKKQPSRQLTINEQQSLKIIR
jgi:hypothetical protein